MRRHVAIVGNGAAAISALETFRLHDRHSRVTIVSGEPCTAYSRVLLPYFLRRTVPYAHLFIRDAAFYRNSGADLLLGSAVERVDVGARSLELADGRTLSFDRLLLAPGSSPVRPPIPGLEGPEIQHLWRLDEAGRLDRLFREGARAVVIGAGFVSLQAAWAARQRGLEVTVVELAERILPTVLDEPGAHILRECVLDSGVGLHTGAHTEGVVRDERGSLRVSVEGLPPLAADVVIVGTGVRPNDHLLAECVAPGQRGITVDDTMQTAVEGVYAAGDVARGPVVGGGPRTVHALWPTAVEQGKIAGANLAGARAVYPGSLSMNVTSMFGVTVASLGRFAAEEGDSVVRLGALPGLRYLQVVVRDGVPAGAVALGGARAAAALGYLRPFVRRQVPVADVEAVVTGEHVAGGITPGRTRGRAVLGSFAGGRALGRGLPGSPGS